MMINRKTKILFVGLSNKPNLEPFDIKTNSGKVVDMIIDKLECDCFKANLVSFAPIDENNKLRYPTKIEINNYLSGFIDYLNKLKPDLIISFGTIISNELSKIEILKNKVLFKQHPSYIYIYKRKDLDGYIKDIIKDIELFFV